MNSSLDRLLRLPEVIGRPAVTEVQAAENRRSGKGPKRARPAVAGFIPVGKSCWWQGIRDGRYPPGLKIKTGRGTFWRLRDIMILIESGDGPQP